MDNDQRKETCPEDEAQRRFEELLRAALNTPPKPMKENPRQRQYRPRKRKSATPKDAPARASSDQLEPPNFVMPAKAGIQ